jgi:hypothetical protein
MKIVKAAILTGYRRLKDKSLRLTFTTQEANTNDLMNVDSMLDQFGILYFRTGEQPPEVDELDNIDIDLYDQKKSSSQRLRSVFYLVWKTNHEHLSITFDEFYKIEMEKIINHYKNKIE